MCVINVSNKRKTGKWRKICLFPAGFEPATLCVWGTRDNRYTKETWYTWLVLSEYPITEWPEKRKKPSSHLGVEPRTFGLEVQRAIHCANGTLDTHCVLRMALFRNVEIMTCSSLYKSVPYFNVRPYMCPCFKKRPFSKSFVRPSRGSNPGPLG